MGYLPLAIATAVPLVGFFVYRSFRARRAIQQPASDLPVIAAELGLTYIPGAPLGTMRGQIHGYAVEITAGDTAHVTIDLKTDLCLNAATDGQPDDDDLPFDFGDDVLDRVLVYRTRDPHDELDVGDTQIRALRRFIVRWHDKMHSIDIGGSIACIPILEDQPRRLLHVPREVAIELVPDLVKLAKALDSGSRSEE